MSQVPPRSVIRKLMVRVTVAGAVVGLGVVGFRYFAAAEDDGPTSVPACSWPLHVEGASSQEQSGLIRCYVRALADHSVAGLQAVADNDPPVRITGAQFAHAADARAGTATATFVPNQSDDAYVTVDIVFADGVRNSVPMLIANPESAHSWRLQIGVAAPESGPRSARPATPPPMRTGTRPGRGATDPPLAGGSL